MLTTSWKLSVDPEFRAAQRALSSDERARLKASIAKHGCRDPIVAWYAGDDTRLVIDGHNRFEICQELRLPIKVVYVRLPDRAAVLDWIRNNQLARRNLTPAERNELLARDYAAEVSRRKSEARSPKSGNGAQGEPRVGTRRQGDKETRRKDPRLNKSGVYVRDIKKVQVPLPRTSRCSAEIRLVEQLDGTWVYGYDWSRRGSGVGCGYSRAAPSSGGESFESREAALHAAGKDLLRHAERTRDAWPANAIKAIRAWQALPQNGGKQKAAAVVAEKHGVSPATVKRAAKAAKARDRIARETSRSLREVAALKPAEIDELDSLSDQDLREALSCGIEAWRLGKEREKLDEGTPSRNEAKGNARKNTPRHFFRTEAERLIERYLDSIDTPSEAWEQSGYLLEALNQWRGRNKPAEKSKVQSPKSKVRKPR